MTRSCLRKKKNSMELYKVYISDKIVESKMRDRYGKDYKLKMEMQYQHVHKRMKIDVGFTADKKAFWIFKYKGEYYMNIVDEVELKDKYTVIDLYCNLVDNACESFDQIKTAEKL